MAKRAKRIEDFINASNSPTDLVTRVISVIVETAKKRAERLVDETNKAREDDDFGGFLFACISALIECGYLFDEPPKGDPRNN